VQADLQLTELFKPQKVTARLVTGGDAAKARFRASNELCPTLANAGVDKKLSSALRNWQRSPQCYFFLFGEDPVPGCIVENDETAPAGLAFACFGFFFSRLLLC
jgi:hypothetical protein